jgi:ABC-type sugar transport system permease subunit
VADAVLTEGAATAAPSRGARRRRRSRDLTPLLMLTPAVLVFLCVQVFPMVFSAGLSFFQWDGLSPARFVGLDNFKAFLVDDTILRELFWRSVWNNVRLAIYLTVGVVLIAVPLATAMNAASQRANALFRTTLLLPMVTAGIAVFYAWTALLGAGGPVVTVFDAIGIGFLAPEGGWFSDPKLALIGLAVVMIWSNVPYATLFYLSGLQSIDGSVYEAARIDGANRFQQLRHITWPLLHPITLIVVTLNVVYAMQSYEMVYLMTNGGPTYATNTVGLLSYNLAFGVIGGGSSQYGAAAAITWCLVLGLALGFGSVRVLRALVRRGRR